jgi:hypothetical protein
MQAHLASRPQLLLSLLYRIISLQKLQLWIDGRQTLQQFKVQLLLSLHQQQQRPWVSQQQQQQRRQGVRHNKQQQQQQQWNEPLWSQLVEVLQYQAVLQLFGSKYFWRQAGADPAAAVTRYGSSDGSSDDGYNGRLSGAGMMRLVKQRRLPSFQCSFKVGFCFQVFFWTTGGGGQLIGSPPPLSQAAPAVAAAAADADDAAAAAAAAAAAGYFVC